MRSHRFPRGVIGCHCGALYCGGDHRTDNELLREKMHKLSRVLEQAQCFILGDTPEDMTHEEARLDTLEKIREALNG